MKWMKSGTKVNRKQASRLFKTGFICVLGMVYHPNHSNKLITCVRIELSGLILLRHDVFI